MPLNFFFGSQMVTPTNAMVAEQTYSDPITSISSVANFPRTDELNNFVPSYSAHAYNAPPVPPRGAMPPIGPITHEMFDRYVQRLQNRQRPVGPTPPTGQTGSPQVI